MDEKRDFINLTRKSNYEMCMWNTLHGCDEGLSIVLTAGFSIDILIGDFQLSFCTQNTQRKFLGHLRKNVRF